MQENNENFKEKEKASYPDNDEAVTITNVIDFATEIIWKAELALVEDQIQKSCSRPRILKGGSRNDEEER